MIFTARGICGVCEQVIMMKQSMKAKCKTEYDVDRYLTLFSKNLNNEFHRCGTCYGVITPVAISTQMEDDDLKEGGLENG